MTEIDTNIENAIFKNGVAQEDNDFVLTHDQEMAVARIKNWYSRKGSSPIWKRYFVLSGAAGTGKTSLIQYIIKNLNVAESSILCCAFTGKASLNLQRKGNKSSTLHSSIYECSSDLHGNPVFTLKNYIPYKLIIVDEASMISEDIFNDILSFGIPTIFVGDHCQLPPIEGDFNIMKKPDFTLTSILRQAKKSPIIRASQLAINGKPIPYCSFEGFRKIHMEDLEDSDFLWASQIIVGTNSTRKALNQVSREIRNIRMRTPVKGERMIVLRNNPHKNLFNGQIVYLASDPVFDKDSQSYSAEWVDELELLDPLITISSKVKDFRFRMKDPYTEPKNVPLYEYVYLDFGYAISCHKGQGSGWDKVMVFDEGFGFDLDTRRRWLYTAITRAKKEILIVSK